MSDSTARCVEELTDSQSDSTPLRCEAAQHLNEEDFRSLEASSWIDRQTATLAGLRRVDSLAAAEMLRRSDGARRDYAGILFPYVLPGRQHPHSYRIRRDHPEYEVGTDGQPKQINKYLSASGTQNRLYFTPGTRSEDLADIDLPLIIVEGEKKALSLFRLAKHSADPRRFLAVGIAGAWNWRGVNGKTVNEKGERVNTHGAIPDLGLLHLSGRLVLVAFDADCRTNDHVASARTGLIKELRRRGARTRTFEIPETSGTKGIDELLVKWGPNKVEDLMREAFNSSDATSTHY